MFGNVLTLQTAHGDFLMLCQMVLLPNINFLISKQNKTPKIDPKMVKQQAGIATFRHTLSFTQTNRALELNINTVNRYINTSKIPLLLSTAFILWLASVLIQIYLTNFHVWYVPGSNMYYINSRQSKLHLNSHSIKNLLLHQDTQ